MSTDELVKWALFGAGVGRLLAVDTLLERPRAMVLERIESPTLVDGLTCPSCLAWHCVFWGRVVVCRDGFFSAVWWRDQMAAWALASILTRKGG